MARGERPCRGLRAGGPAILRRLYAGLGQSVWRRYAPSLYRGFIPIGWSDHVSRSRVSDRRIGGLCGRRAAGPCRGAAQVTLDIVLGAILAAALFVYLLAALLRPERF
ncbi:K(+)-transporting ATPase subunit F [Youhaiella tibetensis]|uniref:K(+)-transporting ATPase subunit F n=1 Tax=Paradevosia tibetensis TaxID=1447062 RepID=A0A5B9DU69_9HYPH|nr:K(+)-transporting ATPase subunit F [Youhaiella tibetensis]